MFAVFSLIALAGAKQQVCGGGGVSLLQTYAKPVASTQ